MKKCIVFGSCHVWPLRKYFTSSKTFSRIYQMIEVPAVHQCDRTKGVDDSLLKKCDLFIYQKVSDSFGPLLSTEYLKSRLPDHCIKISIGTSYFSPYYPQFDRDEGYTYGDKNVVNLFKQGLSKEQIISKVSDENFYSFQEVKKVLDDSIDELKRREKDVDVPVVDFLEKNYQDIRLFYVINHPAYPVFRYIAMNVLRKLRINEMEIKDIVHDDFAGFVHPIYPSVIKHLNLRFVKPNDKIPFERSLLTFQEYIAKYIDFLSRK